MKNFVVALEMPWRYRQGGAEEIQFHGVEASSEQSAIEQAKSCYGYETRVVFCDTVTVSKRGAVFDGYHAAMSQARQADDDWEAAKREYPDRDWSEEPLASTLEASHAAHVILARLYRLTRAIPD